MLASGSIVGGCATSSEPDAELPQAQLAQPLIVGQDAEGGSVWSVGGKTPVVADLVEFSAAAPLKFKVKARVARTVDILLEARGLDRRISTRLIQGGVAMAANSVLDVYIAPSLIPVQSVGGVVQITLKARYVEGGATVVSPLGPESVFVTHSIGYTQAWATTGNLLTLGIAARTARLDNPVGVGDMIAKSASFANDPASDIPLAKDLLKMARFETGRFDTNGVWTTMASAQAKSPYKGGGSFRWPTKLYNQVRAAVGVDPVAWKLLPAPIAIKVCPSVEPFWRDSGPEAILPSNTSTPLPTVGAVIRIQDDTTVGFSGRLDASGCAQAKIVDDAPCFGVEVRSDQVGGGTTQFAILGAPSAVQPAASFTYTIGVCYDASAYLFLPPPAAVPSFSPIVGTSFSEPVSRVLPIAARIASVADSGFLNGNTVHRINATDGCPTSPSNVPGVNGDACYFAGTDIAHFGVKLDPVTKAKLDIDTTVDKFVIALELGHMAQNWSTGSTAIGYSTDSNRPSACKCDGVVSANRSHCLNSRENVSSASVEGWGHFMAAKLLNDTSVAPCSFNYYKEVWNGTGPQGQVLVKNPPSETRVSCTTPAKWRNTKCAQVETGTEWDWLTFLTNVHTQGVSKLNMTELTDVWQRACGTSGVKCNNQSLTWTSTTSPIASSPAAPVDNAVKAKFGVGNAKYLNWALKADENGVSNNLTL